MNDNQIMAIFPQDEEKWFLTLIDHYTPYVTTIISGIAKGALTASDIEEVAADVFFKTWRSREQIKAPSLKAFVAQITRNATIDRLRVKDMEFVPYDDDVLQISCPDQTDDLAILRDQKQAMEDAVRSFGEPDREIFIRYYYFGESLKIISDKLGLKVATAKTKLHRSRSRLRSILEERGYGCE